MVAKAAVRVKALVEWAAPRLPDRMAPVSAHNADIRKNTWPENPATSRNALSAAYNWRVNNQTQVTLT